MPKGFAYILECSDGSFYTGSTIDLEKRFVEHQEGKGANHTKKRLPVKLVYFEEFQRIDDAFYREKQIQGWSRIKKEALIERKFLELSKLAECKNDSHYKMCGFGSAQPPENTERSRLVTERSRLVTERSRLVTERSRSYSNGKLLITGEYLVLDGAKSLAIPTKFGQDLIVNKIKEPSIVWESYDEQNNCWFEAEFRLSDLRIVTETFDSIDEDSKETIAVTLQKILQEAKRLNPDFLSLDNGFHIKTNLNFPRNWGLGTSSTLINNIASWAHVDAFELLNKSFGGSGYDIACAQNDKAIFYQLENNKPIVKAVNFQPSFSNQLYFVHLNVKQNSKSGIKKYREFKGDKSVVIKEISIITEEIVKCNSLLNFEKLLKEHEQIISKIIQNKPIQDLVFSDYFGQTKSLGAWGGDFILATGNKDTPRYFKEKGFETVIPYKDMVL